jgi:RNA polymerase sigma-70 factor (ECF subfamily)
VLQHKDGLASIRDMRPWLVRIAWNLALDRKRRVSPEQIDEAFAAKLGSRERPADEALADARCLKDVLAVMERLPQKERDVLLLSAVEELTTVEIAAVLGKTESSVRSLIFRARTHLQERLRKGGRV